MAWTQAGNIRGPQGLQGATGATGTTGPAGPVGPAGLNWRGPWASANSYAINDSVSWGGSTYFATATRAAASAPPTGTAGDPGLDTALNAGWALIAIEGAVGPQGVQGVQGTQGPTGPTGPQGLTGPQGTTGTAGAAGTAGTTGATGTRGSQWYTGTGAPGTIAGSILGDKYLDTSNGDVYNLV